MMVPDKPSKISQSVVSVLSHNVAQWMKYGGTQ